MYSTSQFRNGLRIEIKDHPFIIVDFQHVKPGKGGAFVRTKIKSLLDGHVEEPTFRSGEKVGIPEIEEKTFQFLYSEGDEHHFMDQETFEQMFLTAEQLGDDAGFLPENENVDILYYKGKPVGVTLPNFIEVEITHCEPGVKGDTATNVTKPATISSGGTVGVPLFVNEGDWIRVDTRTRTYMERVKK